MVMSSEVLGCSRDGVVKVGQDVEHSRNTNHVGVHVVRIHYGHGISCGVVVAEVVVVAVSVLYDICHGRNSLLIQWSCIDCLSFVVDDWSIENAHVLVPDWFDYVQASWVTNVAKS